MSVLKGFFCYICSEWGIHLSNYHSPIEYNVHNSIHSPETVLCVPSFCQKVKVKDTLLMWQMEYGLNNPSFELTSPCLQYVLHSYSYSAVQRLSLTKALLSVKYIITRILHTHTQYVSDYTLCKTGLNNAVSHSAHKRVQYPLYSQ